MTTTRLLKLLKVKVGEEVSEDNDQDVVWLVAYGYIRWDDDHQTHRVETKGQTAIRLAVKAANDVREI